jgi:hypothetical protein
MLKQSVLFTKLKKKKLTVVQYQALYNLKSMKPQDELSERLKEKIRMLVPSIYINLGSCTLSDKGEKLIKEIEMLFKPLKKLLNIDLLGTDFKERIQEFIEIFPTHKLPSNKYARGNAKNIEVNFMWFFQEYPDFTWDTILEATEKYVEEFRLKNYEYMRTAMYFIKKLKDGTPESELANYCDIALNSEDYVPQRQIKSRVV